MLEEAINEALPRFYSRAVQDNSLQTLGQPEVDVTELGDGTELKFTAEVDIRPDFELPAYEGIAVTVPDADVSEDDVNEQVTALQERFATLTGVDRPSRVRRLRVNRPGGGRRRGRGDRGRQGLRYVVRSR